MPETGKAWFITYAIAAWCYRWVILVSISMFLYTVLKPYDLQSLGVSLCVFSMAGIIFSMFRNVYQIVATPRTEPMSKIKIAFSLMVAGGIGWLVASIPIPWYHQAPFFMEPKDVVHVTSGPLAGQILPPDDYAEIYNALQAELDEVCGALNWTYVKEHYGQDRLNLYTSLPTPEDYAEPLRAGDPVVSRRGKPSASRRPPESPQSI